MRLRVCYEKAGILIGFIPLIVYGILAGRSAESVVFALGAATAATIVAGFNDLRRGMVLTWANLALFCSAFIAIGVLNETLLIPFMSVIIYGALAGVAFGSLLVQVPFTLQYARGMVDRSLWENPYFLRVNVLMTGVWGGVFCVNLLLSILALLSPKGVGMLASPLSYLVLIAGILFTLWYPGHVRKKYASRSAQEGRVDVIPAQKGT